MKFIEKKSSAGFIALMSAIIISAILVMVAAITGLQGFYGRWNVLDAEMKEQSYSVAEGCSDMALLQFANDTNYAGNSAFAVDGCICTIGKISSVGGEKSFETQANCGDYYTNLKITINAANLSISSWEELPTY